MRSRAAAHAHPSPLRVAAPPMLAVALVLLAVAPRYGPHWDELYFGMLPPRWWYEDQPPLTVWVTWALGRVSDDLWVQRLPGVVAAVAGAFVATLYPRTLGASPQVQRLAGWAHAFTVYPLIMGHLFTTSTLDLLAWQVVVLCVLRATLGHPHGLLWAGTVAGLACWNKLLVVVLAAALLVGLLLTRRSLLVTRDALLGSLVFVALGAPQVLLQLVHGLPMTQVSGGLVDQQGDLVRLALLPALALFVGPPLLLVWGGALLAPWRTDRPGRFLLPTFVVVLLWTLANPSQPYYPVGVLLPALAVGWVTSGAARRWSLRKSSWVVAANGLVACLVCLPLLPPTEPWLSALSRVNPTIRDQVGWPGYAQQITSLRGAGEDVVVDTYALAGAVHRYGTAEDRAAVHSGHNALWDLGPPAGDLVLLVGEDAVRQRDAFDTCRSAGTLETGPVVHPQLVHVPLLRCEGPVTDWQTLWPRFRRLTG
ncbi:glycosyltransferase family 39 protein [Serinicoccus chungangensis]|uniref:glycosyltransferase family 39 protein n=1 Tax=Serinicoccus chungangensis TaxID=767452 RepID=UPI00128EF7B5|nr:glycosyltransferase family 39 protein [Serinicoccus chungangensis]